MRNSTNNIFINAWSWLIHRVIWSIIHWYLGKRWKELGVNSELKSVFDHIVNIYETEWNENGLFSVLALRKRVKNQISELSVSTFLNNQANKSSKKDYTSLNFETAFKDLAVFKDIFSKVVWTVETLSALRKVLSFIVNILTIPVFTFYIWLLIRKVVYGLGFIATSGLGFMSLNSHTNWFPKDETPEENQIKSVLRSIQKGYNTATDWVRSLLEDPSVKEEVKPVDILLPKTVTNNKWIPSWLFDDEGVNKYIWYTGIAITVVALIGVIYWGWGGDSDGSPSATATGAGIGATIWSMLPEGVQNCFSGWDWNWNRSREDKGKGPLSLLSDAENKTDGIVTPTPKKPRTVKQIEADLIEQTIEFTDFL